MEDNDYVLAFDHFYTNNHIQILKSVIPFMGSESAAMLPVWIKYLELEYTLSLVDAKGSIHASSHESGGKADIETIYNAIRRYLAPNEDKSLGQIVNAMKTMKNVREMQAMMELMDINPGDFGGGGFDINDIMKMFGGNNNGN